MAEVNFSHFVPLLDFQTLLKTSKSKSFPKFSGDMEMEYRFEMGLVYYKNSFLNGLISEFFISEF